MPLPLKASGADIPHQKVRAKRKIGIVGQFLRQKGGLIEPSLYHPGPVKWYRRHDRVLEQDGLCRAGQPQTGGPCDLLAVAVFEGKHEFASDIIITESGSASAPWPGP